jgi:hemolysin III
MKKLIYQEEFWNTATHGIGLLLSITALVVLIILGINSEHEFSLLSGMFFGISLIFLYTSSSLYHLFRDEKTKNKLRVFDHISIFYLIAGTYTPFALITLKDSFGWWLFGIVWSIAIIGTVFKVFFTGKYEYLSLILYISMGWIVVLDFSNLLKNISPDGLYYLITGGILYTVGTIFYAIHKIPYNHAIWHLFVLAGSIFHFFSILEVI